MSIITPAHVECLPSVCGGKPCIKGTRIRVQDVYVWHELQGLSADEIVSKFPQITLADVYGALTYYWDHRNDIQSQMVEESAFVAQLQRQTKSPLSQKMVGNHAADDSVSS